MYGKLSAFFASRIGDCIGAIAAGLFFIVVSQRSPKDESFIYLGISLIAAGTIATAIALTRRNRING